MWNHGYWPTPIVATSVLGMVIALGFLMPRAEALPAPMSRCGLYKTSDIIAEVRVHSVTCLGETKVSDCDVKFRRYQATLEIMKCWKGTEVIGQRVLVEWRIPVNAQLQGHWSVPYYPGEIVATHLKWNTENRVYGTTWWNGRAETPVRAADTDRLPEVAGQTVCAK